MLVWPRQNFSMDLKTSSKARLLVTLYKDIDSETEDKKKQ